MALPRLEQEFIAAGGSREAFDEVAHGGLRATDLVRQDGETAPVEARALALRALKPGVLLEYHCYNERGRDQGQAILRFGAWIDQSLLQFRGVHLGASDGYYDWWAKANLDAGKTTYHLCEAKRARCRIPDVGGGDNIHVGKRHLVNPLCLMRGDYGESLGLQELREGLEARLVHFPPLAPPVDPGKSGRPEVVVVPRSGLDEAMDGEQPGLEDPRFEKMMEMAQKAKQGDQAPRGRSPKKTASSGFGGVLLSRAQKQDERSRSRGGASPGAVSGDEPKPSGRPAKKRRGRSSSSSKDGSSEEPDFQKASSREVDLIRMSRRDPGCLLRSALKEMSRYLTARGEAETEDSSRGRVLSYLHQILLPQYPKAGLRSQRELITLGSALDLLLDGELGRCGDLLIQRFKAVEASLAADGNWSLAKHQELIPGQASLSSRAELTEAAKAELRALKLKAALQKGNK